METEIIGVILVLYASGLWILYARGQFVLLGEGQGLFLAVELQADLATGIRGTNPAHQGVSLFGRFRFEFKHPTFDVLTPGLHGRPSWFENSNFGHIANSLGKWSGREDSNLRPPAPKAGALPDCATPRQVAPVTRKVRVRWDGRKSAGLAY